MKGDIIVLWSACATCAAVSEHWLIMLVCAARALYLASE